MENVWDYSVWGTFNLIAVLLLSLLVGYVLKRSLRFLQASLVPASVLGGLILLIVAGIYHLTSGTVLFDTPFFGNSGTNRLEIITYHTLPLGFIATALKSVGSHLSKKRFTEIFNTGVTTVSTYILQGIFGLGITILTALILPGFFPASGLLLPFGYGQGTGQALNYGNIYENFFGFYGGKSFGLTIAAIGFLSACIGGVIYLNILKRKGKIKILVGEEKALRSEEIQGNNEVPMQESMDKITIQIAFAAGSYFITYLLMTLLGNLLPGLRSVIFGFNFLLGVLIASLVKFLLRKLRERHVIKKEYLNNFLLTRISNFFFDLMVVAGIAAIRLNVLKNFWPVLPVLCAVGLVVTFLYNHFVAFRLFQNYKHEQFLMMYGMLTGTASTGIILLREIDPSFSTPASENMVYQNFPAIVFGFPMMFLAAFAPKNPLLTLSILLAFFLVMNLILFRSRIFRKKVKE